MQSKSTRWNNWGSFLNDWGSIAAEWHTVLDKLQQWEYGARQPDTSKPAQVAFAEFVAARYGASGPGPGDQKEIEYTEGYGDLKRLPGYQFEWQMFTGWLIKRDAESLARLEKIRRMRKGRRL